MLTHVLETPATTVKCKTGLLLQGPWLLNILYCTCNNLQQVLQFILSLSQPTLSPRSTNHSSFNSPAHLSCGLHSYLRTLFSLSPHPTASFCFINRWLSSEAVSRLGILAGLEPLRSDSHYLLTVVFLLCSSISQLCDINFTFHFHQNHYYLTWQEITSVLSFSFRACFLYIFNCTVLWCTYWWWTSFVFLKCLTVLAGRFPCLTWTVPVMNMITSYFIYFLFADCKHTVITMFLQS